MSTTKSRKGCLISNTTFRLTLLLLATSALALGFLFFAQSCLGISAVDRLTVVENKVNRLEKEVEGCKCTSEKQPRRRSRQ